MPPTDASALLDRAARVLAGGPGTFSKSPARYPLPFAPEAIVRGQGCYVTGSNGRRYLDTVSALGANLLGYGHAAVNMAIVQQLAAGTSFSCLHPLEVEVAELLCEVLPCAEMCRFCRNGTDATNMTVRLARAVTGKQHVIFVGYSGGGMDSYAITTDRAAGVLPQLKAYNHQLAWGDMVALERVIQWGQKTAYAGRDTQEYPLRRAGSVSDLALIMVEVPSFPWGTSDEEVTLRLDYYREVAHMHGALFCIDEVVTFPRYALCGAQGIYEVTPDLCTVSKAIANGLPLAALVGKRQYMERLNTGDVFASYTFAGETTALAAAKAVINTLRFTDALDNLKLQGTTLGDGLWALFHKYRLPAMLLGTYARLAVRWQDAPGATALELRTLWLAELARRGILWGIGVCFPQCCWRDADTQKLLTAAEEVCELMAQALATGRVQEALPCAVVEDVLAVRS